MTPVQIGYLKDRVKWNLTEKTSLLRIIFNIFQPATTEAMSSDEDRLVKIGVVFHTQLYFENEVGDPPIFLHCRNR